MYALEKRISSSDVWRRCAVCGSQEPIKKVLAGLGDKQNWRMIYVPAEMIVGVEQSDAA